MRWVTPLLTLLLLLVLSRAMIRWLPGDPLSTILYETGSAIPADVMEAQLRLREPFLISLGRDLGDWTRGDWGVSILRRVPIKPLVLTRFWDTLVLSASALFLGVTMSLALGLGCVSSRGKWRLWLNRFCDGFGAISAALPLPWLGPLLIYFFAIKIRLFSLENPLGLPALTLSLGFTGLWSRLIRERVRETLALGSGVGARARGLPEWRILLKYGLVPASGSLTAYLGTQIGSLLAGSFITEIVFDRPGMGMLFVEATLGRDYPVLQIAAFLCGALSLCGSWIGGWTQSLIIPTLRED